MTGLPGLRFGRGFFAFSRHAAVLRSDSADPPSWPSSLAANALLLVLR